MVIFCIDDENEYFFFSSGIGSRRDLALTGSVQNELSHKCWIVQINQGEFTEMAWQAIVASPDVAKESKQQIVETEHLMKALLEQRNGLARRIFAKAGVDNTSLLQATERFIQRQPKVRTWSTHDLNVNSSSITSLDHVIRMERNVISVDQE